MAENTITLSTYITPASKRSSCLRGGVVSLTISSPAKTRIINVTGNMPFCASVQAVYSGPFPEILYGRIGWNELSEMKYRLLSKSNSIAVIITGVIIQWMVAGLFASGRSAAMIFIDRNPYIRDSFDNVVGGNRYNIVSSFLSLMRLLG